MIPIQTTVPARRAAVSTWAIIFANVAIFAFELLLPEQARIHLFYWFGLVPARYTNPEWASWLGLPIGAYWPFLTSQFLHGGWVHILGNLWTLWLFGEAVETKMGPTRFLFFYLLSGIAAGIVHCLTNPFSTIPTVGASGAISGVLAAFFIFYPFSRIILLVPVLFWPLLFDASAFFYVVFWFFIQFYNGTLSLALPEQVGGVAWWAHLGGFAWGLLTAWMFLPPKRKRPLFEPDEFAFGQSWKLYW